MKKKKVIVLKIEVYVNFGDLIKFLKKHEFNVSISPGEVSASASSRIAVKFISKIQKLPHFKEFSDIRERITIEEYRTVYTRELNRHSGAILSHGHTRIKY